MQSRAGSLKQSKSSKHGVGNQIPLLLQEDFCYQHSAFEPDGMAAIKKNIQTIPGNRRLNEHQELAICQYLGCLDNIGLPTRLFMITVSSCTNSTLHFPETTSEISSSQAKGSRYRPEKRTRPRYHPPARTKLSQH